MIEEQKAFEAWAQSQGLNMEQHPLHYLFIDAKTAASRDGWNGARRYMKRLLEDAGLHTIAIERQRQISKGYEASHDNQHTRGEIITSSWGAMARVYAANDCIRAGDVAGYTRRLAQAGAQIAAEIERVNRGTLPSGGRQELDMVAINIGAAVLSKIEDRAVREIAIRNALIAASVEADQIRANETLNKGVFVPQDPTPEMMERGAAASCSLTTHGARAVYQAMLAEALGSSPHRREGQR